MSSLHILALVISASPDVTVTNVVTPPVSAGATANMLAVENVSDTVNIAASEARSRALLAWKKLVSETLQASAKLQRTDLEQAAKNVLTVYQELLQATQLPPQAREEMRQQLRVRLLAQHEKIVEQIQKRPTVLAQQLPLQQQQPALGAATTGAQLLDAVKTIRPNQWNDNGGPGAAVLWQFGAGLNGLGGIVGGQPAGANGRAAQPADHGKELADLIQAVIAPQSWEANGGPGTIRYYAPVQALIIRQTGEGHAQLGDLLNQLRKN